MIKNTSNMSYSQLAGDGELNFLVPAALKNL